MKWNDHSKDVPEGAHAFLSPSKHHWLNYDDEKLISVFRNHLMAQRGTELHDIAARLIRFGIKLPRTKTTLNMYVNDGIGFHMDPEIVLYYSPVCFGTADTICFDSKKKFLRIHDLKTGISPVSMDQLRIYAGIFCLEYGWNPMDLSYELRIYQNDDVVVDIPAQEEIMSVVNKIISSNSLLEKEAKSNG